MIKEEFVKQVVELAKKHSKNFFPSITVAQTILESDYGKSELALNANNFFGIKADKTWTGDVYVKDATEEVDGSLVNVGETKWRKYKTVEDSFIDHDIFLTRTDWHTEYYKDAINSKNYTEQAIGLTGKYATDSLYGIKLIKIIEDNKFYDLDKLDEVLSKVVETPIEKTIEEVIPESMPEPVVPKPIKLPVVELRYNEYRVVSGDTLYSIAKRNNITVDTLVSWNGLEDKNYIKIGDLLIVKDGQFKYTVVSGDTIYKISRKFQTSVESIKSINGLKDNTIYIGQVLNIDGLEVVTAPQPQSFKPKQIEYTVKSGDRLGKIAKKYNVTVEEIVRANGLCNPNFIKVGQKLIINSRK